MTDKKLTDNEIVDGFNHCLYNKNNSCEGCCFKDVVCDASLYGKITTLRMVAEVINRLQADKQNLEIELKAMRGAANSYKAENDKLKKAKYIFANVDYCADDLDKTLKENEELKSAINGFRGYEDKIKAEARKEFAERVKLEFYYEFDELIPSIMADRIDNLLKE